MLAQGVGPHAPKGRIKITGILVPGKREDHIFEFQTAQNNACNPN